MATQDPTTVPTELLIETDSPEATAALGSRLAAVAGPGDLICLWGELGAGKTVLAKGVGAGLGTTTVVASPSFILMAEHAGRLPLFHMDLYRLTGPQDVLDGGLLDERQAGGLTLIEWPERLGDSLPAPRLDVHIDVAGDQRRRIAISAVGSGLERYLAAARA